MATDTTPLQAEDPGAKALNKPAESESPKQGSPSSSPSPTELPTSDLASEESDDRARLEQRQPAYKQYQERLRTFTTEDPSDLYEEVAETEPTLRLSDFLLQNISDNLLRERIVIFDCVEQRVLQNAVLWLQKRKELSIYKPLRPKRNSDASEGIDQYMEVAGPKLLVLTATPLLLSSLSNKNNLFNFDQITKNLRIRNILLLVCARSEILTDKRLLQDRHLGRFRVHAITDYWLLPLLEERYGELGTGLLDSLLQQRAAGLWPAAERQFHATVVLALDRNSLREEIENRPVQASQHLDEKGAAEILADGEKDIETCALFIRGFFRTNSMYVLEKSLETMIGSKSDEWKRYSRDRRAILDLVEISNVDDIRNLFETDRWLLVKLSEAVLERLLPTCSNQEVEEDCLALIILASVYDPEGFGRNVIFRAVGVMRERGVVSWDSALADEQYRARRMMQMRLLIRGMLQQSSTIRAVRDMFDQLAEWHRVADILDLAQDLDLSTDLVGKSVCDYFARAFNEGSEEVRREAVKKLRHRAWKVPSESLVELLRATRKWLPAEDENPSRAAAEIADVALETLGARMIRDSTDGAYKANSRLSSLVDLFGEEFIALALDWMFHPSIRSYSGELLMAHELFLLDWAVPPALRLCAFGDKQGMDEQYFVHSLAGLLSGLSAGRAFGKFPPPLFPAMFIAEWALAGGPTAALARLDKAERGALSAAWSAIDKALEFGAAAIGRLSGRARPATEYARRIRSTIRTLKSALAHT